EESNDRLVLADPDSGLLLIRSDAPSPGHDRLGWGVLGSTLPLRFPESLRLGDCGLTPFAIQPGQVLMPESCAVALRIDGKAGTWVGVWRPAEGQVHHLRAPEGWLAGAGRWTPEGVLQLPYSTAAVPCGVTWVVAPAGAGAGSPEGGVTGSAGSPAVEEPAAADRPEPVAARPVPLQQAPLTGRPAAGRRRLGVGADGKPVALTAVKKALTVAAGDRPGPPVPAESLAKGAAERPVAAAVAGAPLTAVAREKPGAAAEKPVAADHRPVAAG
ncbi:MAG: hypothetical protein QOC85_2272, partial [Streptomyces sp.]|nr:hypothetical protein [Streptomyces sp.]